MAGKDIIAMSQEELKRLSVIHKAIDGRLTQVEAGGILDISDRQVRRIIARIEEDGDKGVVHRSRGQPSHNAIDIHAKRRALKLLRTTYEGFGPTLAQEKLFERDKIKISRETLRQWLRYEKLPYRADFTQPHLFYDPILERLKEPLDSALGRR